MITLCIIKKIIYTLVNKFFKDFRETSMNKNRAIIFGFIAFSFFKIGTILAIVQLLRKMPSVKQNSIKLEDTE